MRDAIGGSLLLNIVVIFTTVVILLFVGIIAYTKAYRVKNRIIEVIENYETYDDSVEDEINENLRNFGYVIATPGQIESKCGSDNLNTSAYLYCVYIKSCDEYDEANACIGQRHYEVVTYTRFEIPVIHNLLTFSVKGETKMLGKNYNY